MTDSLIEKLKPAAIAAGIIDLDALVLIDAAAIELGAFGNPKDPKAVIAALRKEKPHLFKPQQMADARTMSAADWKTAKRKLNINF